jgi:polar amino acid transport system substrate-binding protein
MKALFLFFLMFLSVSVSYAQPLTFLAEDYPPFEFEENGVVKGFTVDLLKEAMKDSVYTGSFKILPWARAEKISRSGKNKVIHTLTRSESRETHYKWVGPVAHRDVYFYKLKNRGDIQIAALEDAKKYKTGVIRGHAITKLLLANGFRPSKQLVIVGNDVQRFELLARRRVDLIEFVAPVLHSKLQRLKSFDLELEKVFLIDGSKQYYIGFSLDTDDQVVDDFNRALNRLSADGTLEVLRKKYGL